MKDLIEKKSGILRTIQKVKSIELYYRKVEVDRMAKEIDLKKIVSNLAKAGVSVTLTKSRLDLLKVLVPPAQDPHVQSN